MSSETSIDGQSTSSRVRQKRTLMQERRVGATVAEPDVEAGVVCREGAAAGDAVGDPPKARVQDAVHEEHGVPRICNTTRQRG